MPSTTSGESYKPSSSSQKCHGRDYGRSQSDTEGKCQPEGLQQCTTAQRVQDPCRSVEKLHELIPDCKKIPGSSQHLQVTQLMASIDGKEEYDAFNGRMEEEQPSTTKARAKTSRNSNVKKHPQAQNKGKGKAPPPKTYSQGYRMPWEMWFRWPEP
ncbi:hypothetical protein O181_093500 [Austropuccinia psidii MF-1]|uniref:Uncharacterized protein n=1 Tax=Austropuccinia psidii MF-1 TaxID=1389203 RepID=A0A9Q3J0E0_9BASI|nr:hypothetical protein [Austropuccinia psidii MF-1]